MNDIIGVTVRCLSVKIAVSLSTSAAMQSTLFRVPTIFVRSVARKQTLASQRTYSGSTGGGLWTLHASRVKTLVLAGGITFVAASTSLFVHSRINAKELSEEQIPASRWLLKHYGLEKGVIDRKLSTFQHLVGNSDMF